MVDVHRTRSTKTFPIGLSCIRLVNQYDLFVLEVLKGPIRRKRIRKPSTIHRYDRFAVDDKMINLKSRMR